MLDKVFVGCSPRKIRVHKLSPCVERQKRMAAGKKPAKSNQTTGASTIGYKRRVDAKRRQASAAAATCVTGGRKTRSVGAQD